MQQVLSSLVAVALLTVRQDEQTGELDRPSEEKEKRFHKTAPHLFGSVGTRLKLLGVYGTDFAAYQRAYNDPGGHSMG